MVNQGRHWNGLGDFWGQAQRSEPEAASQNPCLKRRERQRQKRSQKSVHRRQCHGPEASKDRLRDRPSVSALQRGSRLGLPSCVGVPQRPGREHQQEEIGQAALAAGKDYWLYSRAFQPHEVDTRTGFTTTVAHKTQDWAKFSPEDGPVYHDGSCVGGNSTHPRAAWAAVQTDTNGKEIKALWGGC